MRILNVAYPFAPAGPNAVGGAEQVLTQIVEALVRSGHDSFAVACQDSLLPGTLATIPSLQETIRPDLKSQTYLKLRRQIEQVVGGCSIDLIHFHGIDFYEYLPDTDRPILVTLHLPITWYPPSVLEQPSRNLHFQCVSASQQRSAPASVRFLPVIENGVPIERLRGSCRRRRFALSLGRICPEKGFHHAIRAAQRADTDFLLGGAVFPYPAHQEYFQRQIAPRLDRRRRFLGPVGFRQKKRLLNSARCLLVPSLAPETSSLVAMEALACGTPVIAFRAGALADLVEPGKTGFLVQDEQEMAEAIHACGQIDTEACQAEARRRFPAERMTRQYLALYEYLLAQSTVSRETGCCAV